MNRTIILHRNVIAFGLPLCLLGILIFFMNLPAIRGNDALSLAITVDLLLLVPLIYFLLIRKSQIPNTTVIPVMIAGLIIGSYFLPKEDQAYLTLFKTWVLPVVELSVLTFIIVKVRSAIKKYQVLKGAAPDFFTAVKSTCEEILPQAMRSV